MVQTLAALQDDFCRGASDPVEALEHALEMAERAGKVFISLTPDRARKEARAADKRLKAGNRLGPLDGVPIAWKDLFDLKGERTTAGAELLRQAAPARSDAPVVAALAKAGAASLGKTNLSEFAFSGLGINPHFGTPLLTDIAGVARAPGGSSSGSAVAVRLGVVPVAIGTDTAGSIRIPAAFNGLVGYKPSSLRHSKQGVYPLASTFDSIGPIARTVEDCAIVDAALSGVSASQAAPPIGDIELVVESRIIADPAVEPAVRDNLLAMTDRLVKAGARLTIRPVPAFRAAAEAIQTLGWPGSYEANAFHRDHLSGPDRARMDQRTAARLDRGALISPETYQELLRIRARLQREIAHDLAGAFLIVPTVAHVAPLLAPLEADPELFASVNLATLRLTMIGSFLDMPGIALPTGRDRIGLWTSMQLSAPSGDDDRLLGAALGIERIWAHGREPDHASIWR